MGLTDLHVVQSAVRCPFCHGSVEVAAHDWVVCRACLARHHSVCWEKSCASCGGSERLADAVPPDSAFKRLIIEAQIERLDRRWAERRARFCSGSWGGLVAPRPSDGQGPLIGGLLGIFILMVGVAADAPAGVPIAGILIMSVSGVLAYSLKARCDRYGALEQAYLARRSDLVVTLGRLG